jgi:L-lactate utilization protein LutB
MTHKQEAYETQARTIIKNLEKRNMEGYYFADKKSCKDFILQMIPTGSVVTNGGSMTTDEIGLMDELSSGKYLFVDRMLSKTAAEKRETYSKIVMADYYFMSTNAITLTGELVNIDGAGNRVACLIHGPENIIVVTGMNKVVSTVEEGISRSQNFAAATNVKRLSKKTPCFETGVCADCLAPDCICNQIVITRRSGIKGRIKVLLIGETLGY